MSLLPSDLPLVHGPQWTDRLADWCAKRIPHVGVDEAGRHRFGPCWSVGVMHGRNGDFARGRRLAAVVVLHEFHEGYGTVQLSCASDRPGMARWATPAVVGAILAVPFEGKLGAPVRRVWTATPSTLPAVVRFNEHLGLRREAVLREHYARRVHAVVCGIMKSEWARRYGIREDASKPCVS